MTSIKLSTTVGPDRRLIIDVPDESPPGPVELTIQPISADTPKETVRAKLLAAGALVTYFDIPETANRLSVEERRRLGTLKPGARPSEDLINEDQGEW